MGMEPAYPADSTHNSCEDRRIRPVQIGRAGQNFAGQGRIFIFHFAYRSWDRCPERWSSNGFSTVLAASFPLLANASVGRRGGVGRIWEEGKEGACLPRGATHTLV